MFNKSKFNRTLFNKVLPTKYTVDIESTSGFEVKQKLTIRASASIASESTLELVFKGAVIESTSEMQAKARSIISGGQVEITVQSTLTNPDFNINMGAESGFESKAYIRKWFKFNSDTISDMESRGANFIHAEIEWNHVGEAIFKCRREMVNNPIELTGQNTTDVIGGYVITDVIILTTIFAPGDEIIIDMDAFQVLKNGQNILNSLGDISEFFNLEIGNNTIQYRDTSALREVQATITHQDRYL